MPPIKLKISGLCKRYGEFVALAPTDLEVAEGEFLTLLGPSGSGKTTLLNLIAGLALPDSGALLINGVDATWVAPYERDIGMVFQNYALFPHMTIEENVSFPLKMRKLSDADARSHTAEALQRVRLPQLAKRFPRELSGGQQQRIALARCLVYGPSIILMDEPLGALDKRLRDQMQLEIKRIHRELGTTIVYVTHDQEEAMTMSDRICLMDSGKIAQLGSPSDLYFRPHSLFVANFLGESNLFEGVVKKVDGDMVQVMLLQGGAQTSAKRNGAHFSEGQPVRVMVRPQNISIGQASGDGLRGKVLDSMITGSLTKLYLALAAPGAQHVVVSYPTAWQTDHHEVGQQVSFDWQSSDAVVLPA